MNMIDTEDELHLLSATVTEGSTLSYFHQQIHVEPTHGKHLVLSTKVHTRTAAIASKGLLNTGASSLFIHHRFIRANKINPIRLDTPKRLQLADGRRTAITHAALITTTIGNHVDQDLYYVTDLD